MPSGRISGMDDLTPPAEILEYVIERIGEVYRKPMMWGSTGDMVENVLHHYHELWALIVHRKGEYSDAYSSVHCEEELQAALFTTNLAQSATIYGRRAGTVRDLSLPEDR